MLAAWSAWLCGASEGARARAAGWSGCVALVRRVWAGVVEPRVEAVAADDPSVADLAGGDLSGVNGGVGGASDRRSMVATWATV